MRAELLQRLNRRSANHRANDAKAQGPTGHHANRGCGMTVVGDEVDIGLLSLPKGIHYITAANSGSYLTQALPTGTRDGQHRDRPDEALRFLRRGPPPGFDRIPRQWRARAALTCRQLTVLLSRKIESAINVRSFS